MILHTSLRQHFRMLSKLIIYILICSFFVIYFFNSLGKGILILCLFFVFLYVIPVLVIHYNYYLNDKDKVYEITEFGIKQKNKNGIQFIEISKIQEIEFFMTANKLNETGFQSLPFVDYYYASIKVKNESEIVLSCLLSSELENILIQYLPNISIKKAKKFYPLIG